MTVRVEESDYFRREGNDVHTDVDVSLSQAILGGIVRIQGLYEDLNLRIPSGEFSCQNSLSVVTCLIIVPTFHNNLKRNNLNRNNSIQKFFRNPYYEN